MGICSSANDKLQDIKQKIKEFVNGGSFDTTIDEAFDKIDTEKKGEIDSEQVATLVNETSQKITTKIPVITEDKVKSALSNIGAGDDGKLKKEDFKKNVKEALLKITA